MSFLHPRIDPVMTMPAKAALTMLAKEYEIIRAGSWNVKRTFVVQGFILVQRADTDNQFHGQLVTDCFERQRGWTHFRVPASEGGRPSSPQVRARATRIDADDADRWWKSCAKGQS